MTYHYMWLIAAMACATAPLPRRRRDQCFRETSSTLWMPGHLFARKVSTCVHRDSPTCLLDGVRVDDRETPSRRRRPPQQ